LFKSTPVQCNCLLQSLQIQKCKSQNSMFVSDKEGKHWTVLWSSLFCDVAQRWLVVTNVSGQQIGPIFKGQVTCLALEDGTNRLSRNVARNIPERQRPHLHGGRSVKSRIQWSSFVTSTETRDRWRANSIYEFVCTYENVGDRDTRPHRPSYQRACPLPFQPPRCCEIAFLDPVPQFWGSLMCIGLCWLDPSLKVLQLSAVMVTSSLVWCKDPYTQ
jgi:hypothetical protein